MLFNSINFLIFFPIVVSIYYLIPGRARYIWLLISSYYFYMSWNPKYAVLIAISTIITYLSGILIEQFSSSQRKQKIVVALSFVSNISILAFFKYFTFVLSNVNAVLGKFNIHLIDMPIDIILPVGISFYTFQALSYTMDVYRKQLKPEKNILKYALFVSFFPQLVAGPIERSTNLLEQVNKVPEKSLIDYKRITDGLIMMLYGFFLKMVIADRVALIVNHVFDCYFMYGTFELIIGAVAFAIQIYCDFSSYSTIAIGAAQVMGFHLMENFDTPYFAVSIQEFWRRWHISLSSWFKDYLYIPLGGNRCSKIKKYFNLIITFLVSGLWHGASWHYIIWGGIHGIYQVIGYELKPLKQKIINKCKIDTNCFSHHLLQMTVTFILTTFAWIFFRSDNTKIAIEYISRMFSRFNPWVLFNGGLYTLGLDRFECSVLIISIIILFVVDMIKYKSGIRLDHVLETQNTWFKWMVIISLCIIVIVYGEYGNAFNAQQFIYFQF